MDERIAVCDIKTISSDKGCCINYEGEYNRLREVNKALESQLKYYEEQLKLKDGCIEEFKTSLKILVKHIK